MKTFKTFLKFIYILVISLLLLVPRIIVLALAIVESVSRVMKNTTSYFIEQVKNEAYNKILEDGKNSQKKQSPRVQGENS